MRKINILFILIALSSLIWFGCKPDELTTKSKGEGVDSTKMSITVTKIIDEFHFIVSGTVPSGPGITKWVNGKSSMNATDTLYFPIKGKHTIYLSFYNNGGQYTKSITQVTTITDDAYFADPMFKMLTNGSAALDGKDWQLDSLTPGHLGCGPSFADPTSWWAAGSLAKKNVLVMYDDVINFNLNDLVVTYTNHGKSYVNKDYKVNPLFTNLKENDSDFAVDFTPQPGNWRLDKKSDGNYLVLVPGSTPIFPCYYVGSKDNTYKIISLDADHMKIIGVAGDGNVHWQYMLVRKGFFDPRVTGKFINTNTGNGNQQAVTITLSNPDPSKFTISSATIKFGDATADSVITTGLDAATTSITFNHRYLLKGTYKPSVVVVNSKETFTANGSDATFADNDPTYVAPSQNTDATTVYNDFDVEQILTMNFTSAGGTDGTNATGEIVSNPNSTRGPNRSPNVFKFMKTGTQYGNNFMDLPVGSRFDFTLQSTFTYLVYGTAGNKITFKLQNTDLAGNAYTTATADQNYTIKTNNVWELVTVSFKGVAGNGETDVTTGTTTIKGYYNEMVWLIQAGDANGPYTYYIDKVTGPVVAELKK